MMKSNMLFECGPLPPYIHLCPLDIIHVIGVPMPFTVLLCSSASVHYTEHKPKNKKWGRPGKRGEQEWSCGSC